MEKILTRAVRMSDYSFLAPCKKNCVCDDCVIGRQQDRIEELEDALMSIQQASSEPLIKKWASEALPEPPE